MTSLNRGERNEETIVLHPDDVDVLADGGIVVGYRVGKRLNEPITKARLDEVYGQFIVAMQRTGDTKEALRQILLAAGTNQPGGQPGLSSAQAALREAAHEMLCCFYFRFPEEQTDSLPGAKFARAQERMAV